RKPAASGRSAERLRMSRAPATSIPGDGLLEPAVGAERAAGRRARLRARNLAGYAFIAPWLIGFIGFTLLPMGASLYLAFTDYDILTPPRLDGPAHFPPML